MAPYLTPSYASPGGSAFTQALTGGSGDELNYGSTGVGQLIRLYAGTAAAPDTTLNPLLKANRTINVQAAAVTGDGVDNLAAIGAQVWGTAACQVQPVAVYGISNNQGTTRGATDSPDACGIYGVGRILGSGIGYGMGAYFRGSSSTSTGHITSIQADAYNARGVDDSPNTTGTSNSMVMWLLAAGTNRSASMIQMGNAFGVQVHTGIHINGQLPAAGTRTDANCSTTSASATVGDTAAVALDVGRAVSGAGIPGNALIISVVPGTSFTMNKTATATANPVSLTLAQTGPVQQNGWLDEGTSLNSIVIGGTHAQAIAVKAGAGQTIIGGTSAQRTSSLLEIQGPAAAARPLFSIGSTVNTNNFSMYMQNGGGFIEYFIAGNNAAIFATTITGDGGIAAGQTGKGFHIGGTASVIQVTNANTLGFFAATPVAQPTAVGTSTGYTAGATVATFHSDDTYTGGVGTRAWTINGLVAALKNLGIIASS